MITMKVETELIEEAQTAVGRATLTVPEIGPWIGRTYGAVASYLAAQEVAVAGLPFARYHMVGEGRFEVEAGFPVTEPIQGSAEVSPSSLPGGWIARIWHIGPYDAMGETYEALAKWIAEQAGEPTGAPWEIYHSDPQTEPDPATWRTEILQPFKPA